MIWALTASLLAAAPAGPASGASEDPLPPAQEERVQRLGKELRCAVCQGLSIADSPAAMARSQLGMVRELVSQGKSDQEIRDYFVARYGEWALLSPPADGFSLLAWILPIVVLVGGVGVVFWLSLRGRGAPPGGRTPPSPPPSAAGGDEAEADPYLAAIRRAVDEPPGSSRG